LIIGWFFFASPYLAQGEPPPNPKSSHTDAYGDPLPAGAIMRMVSKIKSVMAVVLVLGAVLGGAPLGAGPFINGPAAMAQPRAEPIKPKQSARADETAVTAHIKALRDANSETRAAAAESLRRIVAKYPSGTVYLPSKLEPVTWPAITDDTEINA
jgi:hypothetical protein